MEDALKHSVMLLDGDSEHTLQVAAELKQDLDIRIIAVASSHRSRLLRTRYCDERIVVATNDDHQYRDELLEVVQSHLPSFVLPVTFRSVMAMSAIESQLPKEVQILIPGNSALKISSSKTQTLESAKRLGIRVPEDYTARFRAGESPDSFDYPLFLKIAHEVGGNITALVDGPSKLRSEYERLVRLGAGDDILVQEYIGDDTVTYGCGLLYHNGEIILDFQHEELRSIPRTGGSATRARILKDDRVLELSSALLSELDWNGPALVEFKRDTGGEPVLMEINAKFWASYALASRNGFRFASTAVASVLRLERRGEKADRQRPTAEMVFPLREMWFVYKNWRDESLLAALSAMLIPPAQVNVPVRDLLSYIDLRWFGKLFRRA